MWSLLNIFSANSKGLDVCFSLRTGIFETQRLRPYNWLYWRLNIKRKTTITVIQGRAFCSRRRCTDGDYIYNNVGVIYNDLKNPNAEVAEKSLISTTPVLSDAPRQETRKNTPYPSQYHESTVIGLHFAADYGFIFFVFGS